MGLTLKAASCAQKSGRGSGIGARVTNFAKDSSIVGMVIYDVNGDSSFRTKPLTEIKRSLSAMLDVDSLVVTFGDSVKTAESAAGLPSSSSSSSLNTENLATPNSKKEAQNTAFLAKPIKCELCPVLNKKVVSLEKRMELLEGDSVRRLTVDQLEDLLENAESLASRVRSELAKRVEKPVVECNICLNAKPNQTFVPCGHCICCEECATPLTICPLCRKEIVQKVKTIFS